jgi:hypothetical protein
LICNSNRAIYLLFSKLIFLTTARASV